MNKIVIEGIRDFNLDHIFDCGQCFRWNKEDDGSYTGAAFGKLANMSLSGSKLTITNASQDDFNNIWYDYLDLGTDYSQIKTLLANNDKVIANAIQWGYGIRILNQEIWETICSFIISANNNVPRIKASIDDISNKFGDYIGTYKGTEYFSFPNAAKVATLTLDELRGCSVGYRAEYILDTAKAFLDLGEDFFKTLQSEDVSYETALQELQKLKGVGIKVANCIALFSLKKRSSFPIDTWIKQAMSTLYGFDKEDLKAMSTFAADNFGEHSGIAQQYLFYYMRNKRFN